MPNLAKRIMSPDNEYFWIEPEEVRALAPVSRKRATKVPAQVTEPWLEELSAPTQTTLDPGAKPVTPIEPSPVPVMEASATPMQAPAEVQDHSNALEVGAASFQARTPDERLERFVEWLAERYAGAAVFVISGNRQVVTCRGGSPELLWRMADALPGLLGDTVPAPGSGAEDIAIRRLVPISRIVEGLDGAPGDRACFMPLYCEPSGVVLCLVITGAVEPGKPAAEADAVQRIFAQLAEAMARG